MISEATELISDFARYAGTHEHENYLTLYLDVDQADRRNQSDPPAWRIFLKNAISDIEETLDPVQLRQWKKVRLSDTSPETAWARTRKRVEKYLSSYKPETGKTLVLFISPSVEYKYELPVRLDNAVYYGKPHIQEFLWALDEYEQHLVALFAQDEARALIMALGDTTADLEVRADQAWLREVKKSAHSQNINARDDELNRRFLLTMADRLDKFFLQNRDVQRVILGGNTEMAHTVLGAVHPAVRERVIGIVPIPLTDAPHEVADRIRETARQAERDHELALVNEIIGAARANGRGALGMTAVQRANERGAIQLLALTYPAESDVVEPLLLDAVQSGAQIEFVKDEAAERVREAGGAVARLYYALS